ncbi:ClpP-like prohead protease/major capsid protein fusion protein [Pseudaminobacter soli (ex Li et al. 2025)]|uniref:ATP-dependent Clp protease proteolytic subunit n=1 Tax=Pseudaminobacter soli (ex Li et al. 2025) TaxID=1295366 RepID=A0A2P7RZV8_9HYPH|nr:ClpP-like prohead protease/major capsid protein fusion protein [Mesorhizobium soli]PSJ55768.1 peptidase S14 [Mesorhizobium soli]
MTHRLLVGGEVVLYGNVGDIWGDGTGFTDRDVIDALAEVGPGDVSVRVNSGGGYVSHGVAIYNALVAHPGKVTVSVDAIAASSASVIAMAGDSIVMRTGALLMIHDPSGITIGNAEAHRSNAGILDKTADVIAGIYAKRTGANIDAMRELMKTETWLTADEAVAQGFATATDDTAAEAVAAFDYSIYAGLPSSIPQEAHRARPASPVANATSRKEPIMAQTAPVTATVTPAAPVANHADEIFARCEVANLTMAETSAVMKAAAGDLEKGKDGIINALAARDKQPEIRPVATVTADARDRFKEGVSKSLMAKAGLEGGEVNEFSAMSLREVARESLVRNNVNMTTFRDPMAMVGAAFTMQHSTSDFVEVLANVANKSMLKGYLEAEETFEAWTAKGVLSDFKPTKRVDLNLFPALSEVPEGGEYSYGTIGDRGETIQLATYGKMFSITRQAIINDDLSSFTRIPSRMGRAARRTIGNLVYAQITGNVVMSDGKPLFHDDHGNKGTGGVTMAAVDAARSAMALQKDPDQNATGGLNIRPAFILVPVELEGKATALMAAEFDPAGTQKNPNTVRGLAQVVSEARLSQSSKAKWYLAANPNAQDTIEVAYLNGNSSPVLEQRDGWSVDGAEFKVRIDAGVKALDFRGLSESSGS